MMNAASLDMLFLWLVMTILIIAIKAENIFNLIKIAIY